MVVAFRKNIGAADVYLATFQMSSTERGQNIGGVWLEKELEVASYDITHAQ